MCIVLGVANLKEGSSLELVKEFFETLQLLFMVLV